MRKKKLSAKNERIQRATSEFWNWNTWSWRWENWWGPRHQNGENRERTGELKVGQQMLPSLRSREKADWEEEPDQNLRDLGPGQKHHRPVIRVPEGEGKGGWKNIQRNMGENFPNLGKDLNLQTQEAEWPPKQTWRPRAKMHHHQTTPRPPQGRSYCYLVITFHCSYQRMKSWCKYFPFKIERFSTTSENVLTKRNT